MVEIILYAVLLGFTLSFMVGPVFFVLLETSLIKGARKAVVFDLGVISADILFIGITFFGSSLLEGIEDYSSVYLIGGILVVGYGIYNLRNAKLKKERLKVELDIPNKNAPWYVYFFKGFFLNFLNVGVLAWWLTTMVVVSASVDHDKTLMTVYFAVTLATYFGVDLLKIFFARKLKKKLTPMVLLKIEKTIGVILIVFGIALCFRGYIEEQIGDKISDYSSSVSSSFSSPPSSF